MKSVQQTILAAMLAIAFASSAAAETLRFTATSAGSGLLGWLEIESAILDGTAFQGVNNSAILDLSFSVAGYSYDIGDVSLSGATFFDSSGASPIVVNGGGFNYLLVGLTSFFDVSWSAAAAPSTVPLPGALPLFACVLGLGGVLGSRKRKMALAMA